MELEEKFGNAFRSKNIFVLSVFLCVRDKMSIHPDLESLTAKKFGSEGGGE